jgi:hypothetical protein
VYGQCSQCIVSAVSVVRAVSVVSAVSVFSAVSVVSVVSVVSAVSVLSVFSAVSAVSATNIVSVQCNTGKLLLVSRLQVVLKCSQCIIGGDEGGRNSTDPFRMPN